VSIVTRSSPNSQTNENEEIDQAIHEFFMDPPDVENDVWTREFLDAQKLFPNMSTQKAMALATAMTDCMNQTRCVNLLYNNQPKRVSLTGLVAIVLQKDNVSNHQMDTAIVGYRDGYLNKLLVNTLYDETK
jgi:hypothetical protein